MKYVISAENGGAKSQALTATERAEIARREAAWGAKKAAAEARRSVAGQITSLMQTTDPENQIMAAVLKEIAIDVAALRGMTPAQYRADLISRLSR